jgi:plastocyanin
VLCVACSTSSNAPKTGSRITLDGRTILNRGTVDVGGQTAEDLQTRSYFFDPTVFAGSGGQTITLSIHNTTDTTHNFSLPQQQIDQDVPPGQTVQVSVTLPASGELVFFCRFHRSRGMLGALEAG